jgi:hypothetical protein
MPQTSVVLPPLTWKTFTYFHSTLDPFAVAVAVPSDHVVVIAENVVNVNAGRGAHRLALAGEEFQHISLAPVGTGPLAVAPNVPDDVVGEVFVHPCHGVALERRETRLDELDIRMRLVSQALPPRFFATLVHSVRLPLDA